MKIQIAIALFFSMSIFSQVSNQTETIYNLFDEIIGEGNTSLSYGKFYSEKYRTLNDNHQYLEKNQFTKGLVTYQNQTFYNVYLKYNTSEDFLIVSIGKEIQKPIVLEKALVTNFKLFDRDFISNKKLGYLEILFENKEVSFFKKNKKNRRKKLNESYVYYKFLEDDAYYLKIDKEFYEIKNKKDIIQYFPEQKKLINNTYKIHKKLARNQKEKFYPLLGKALSNAIKNTI